MSGAMMDKAERLNLSAGLASVGTALFLVGLKLWALIATGALSVGASLADSLIDLMASSAGLAGIVYAAKPPDEDHSFGHSSAEDLVGLGQALFVAVSAGLIAWTAVERLMAPRPLVAEGFGVAAMAAAMVVTAALVLWQGRVARSTGSRIVAADRLHYVADLLPAAGAIVALYAAGRWGVLWLDPVVALVACAVLLMGARQIGLGAWHALMDRAAGREVIETVERIVAGYPDVIAFHDLKTRTAGSRVFIQIHLELDGDQSLRAAHAIGAGVRRALIAAIPNADVIIHHDPADPPERPPARR
jgi:ferrous-iron efflux pump FieF